MIVLLLVSSSVAAQMPARLAEPPRTLPASVTAPTRPAPPKLARDENLATIDLRGMRIERRAHQLALTLNGQIFRTFNPQTGDAEATEKLMRELAVVRWGTIGQSRIVVEYGLTVGSLGEHVVPLGSGFPTSVRPVDLKTVRVEAIRGAWCLVDNGGALLNFGPEKTEAEQALGVCQKYGFNRIGTVGSGPSVTYFFAAMDLGGQPGGGDLQRVRAEVAASRTGIDVPGLGFVGERMPLDPKKLVVLREKTEVTLRHGTDVIASFGSDEWAAGDALRVIKEARFSEFCRFGTAGVSFFLVKGKPPTQVPFHARTTRFDLSSLRAMEMNGKWWLMDVTGKPLLPAGTEAEAHELIRLLKAFGFDTLAQIGGTPTARMQFLAKSK